MLSPVADLLDTLTELGIDRSHFVGASFGAAVAVEAALTQPGQVVSLLLSPPGGSLIAELTPDLRAFIEIENAALEHLVRQMQRRVFEVTAGWDDIEERELDPAALDLTEIRVPTLVLGGPLDIEAVQQAARQALNDLDPRRHHDFRRYDRRHDDAAPCSPLRLRSGKDAGLLHRRTGHEGDRAPC
jgi:3-oxoadipate enol-lactonase